MFGGGGFGSNNNNNTGGGIFGGGGGFGQNNTQNTGFGAQTNTAFGQPAQQNTGGGMFGQANNTQSSGFGFGQTAQQPQQNNAFGSAGARPGFGATGGSTFGQPANNTGGGMFGATTSTFGQQNNTTNTGGLFGGARPAGSTGMGFGSGSTSTLFGAKPATNTFGAAQNNTLQPNQVQPYTAGPDWPPIPQTGTANPQYFPTWQQDPNASGTGPSTAPPHLFHAISAMPPYRGASFEELRLMDYQQGRKDAGVQGASAAGGFGATNTGTTGFGTGSTGTFGAPANTGTTNAFGAGATNNAFGAPKPGGLFGSTGTTTGGFGSTSTNTGGGLFGQNNAQQTQPSAFGATTNTGGGLFGSQNQQQNTTGGGLFGNTNPFGANNNNQQQQPASTGFSFGAKPATTGFGATPATGTGAFGSTAPATGGFGTTNTTGSTGFGGFGQQNQQQPQQPAATGGLFGGGGFGTNTTQPAQNTTGGLFGSNTTQQPSTGGLFGSTAPKPAGGLFGSTTTPATGSTGFGGFGQTAAQPAAPATNTGLGGGLFGSNNTTSTTTTGGGLFGQQNQQQPAQQPAATGGLFGGSNTSSLFGKPATPAGQTGGLFGSTQPAQPAAPSGGLFGGGTTSTTGGGLFGTSTTTPAQGQQPSTGGLFGGGGGLFGQQNQQTQQPAATGTTGSLFGGGLGTSGGLFGGQQQQQQPAQQPAGSSLFGGFGGGLGQSTTQQQQQPTLVASIDQNPYGSSPLFQTPGIQLQPVASTKKPALPPALNSSFRVTPNRSQINKLRGFASPLAGSYSPARAGSVIGSPRAAPGSPRVVPGSPAMSDRYKGLSDMALSPHAFIPRENIKRLSIGNKGLGAIGSDNAEEALLGKSLRKPPTPSRDGQNGTTEASKPNGTNGLVFNQSRPEAASHRRNGSDRDVFASSPSAAVVGTEKLKKGEYWCKPRLERLKQMTQAELRSVNHFTVGCKGKGEVTFKEPVDLTGLDLNSLLGEIVTFGNSEMTIYCDGRPKDEKPSPGSGLNHPATITLEGVWAVDKASKKPIRDEKDPRLVKFVKRLRAVGKFVDYEVENGVWTFEVEHFSRWGVPDSSDEEDDGHWEVDEVQRRRERSASSGEDIHVEQEQTEDEAGSEEDEEDENFMPPTRGLRESAEASEESVTDEESVSDEAASSHSWASGAQSIHAPPHGTNGFDAITDRLGEDGARKIRAMQSDLFGGRSAPRYPGIDVRKEKDALMGLKRTLREKGFEFAEEEDDATHDDRAVKRASFGEQVESPRIQVQPRKYARVALDKSTVNGNEGSRVDAGLAMGRSFRCSWGPNGELVHFGKICKPASAFSNGTGADVFIEDLGLLAHDVPTEVERANRLLDLHLERTQVEVMDGVPVANLDETIRFGDFTKLFEGGNRSHEANIWRLGVALFDEIDLRLPASATEETVDRISAIRRKLALSKWLENAVTPLVDHDLVAASTNAPLKVFRYLSGNQLERAVQAAIDAGDMRLATLVSQLGCPENVREEVIRQLEDWHKYKNNSVIADGYRRLYALFAGIMDVVPGDSSRGVDRCADVIVSSGLDWKRAFGLRLWYGNPADHSVGDVLATYAQDLQAAHAPAKPLPAYLEKPAPLAKEWTMSTEPTDVLYGLIRLYADITVSLDDVLRARDCSPSPLDARLQWHLALLLSQALRKRDFADRTEEGYSAQADAITAAYAAQLEESGQWTRAAFVLLHLQTIDGRADAIKALLHRHPNSTDEERAFLLRRCRVPQTWLHEAKAAELASEDDAFGEFKELLQADLSDRAHWILKDKLAIEAILRGDDGLLKKLCLLFEGREPPEWEYGGQLFLDYIETKVELPRLYASVLRAGPSADPTQVAESHRLLGNISRLIQLLPAIFPDVNDPRQAAALSDMLSTLAGLEASLNGKEAKGSKGRMVPGDRLAILQSVAVQDFERSVAVLA